MTVLGNDDTLLALPTHCKRSSPDYSSEEEEDLHNNFKRHKTNADDLLILFEEEVELFSDHIVPVESVLLQQTLGSPDTSLDFMENIESSWVTSLLDSDRSHIATLEFSFVDDGFSIEGGFL